MRQSFETLVRLTQVFLLVLLLSLGLISGRSHVVVRPITTFESHVRINQDGSALILESYEFASSSGGFTRNIITDVPAGFGSRKYFIDIASVDDDHGRDVPYSLRRSSNGLEVHVAGFAGNRLQIVYKVRNAVQFGAENDEFVWIANPLTSPIETARLNVSLPEAAAGQIRSQGFLRNGGASSRNALFSYNGQVMTGTDGSSVEAVSPGPLTSGVAATMHICVPSGILTSPGVFTRMEWFLRANPIVFFPFCVFAVMYLIRWMKRRHSDPGRSVVPLYEPPAGLTPAEVGMLIDDSVDPRDVTATLIDLAVRGYVRLERIPPEQAHGGDVDYVVRLLKPMEEWSDLKLHERTMLFHSFYGGHWTQLSSLKLRFPDIVPYMKDNVFESLKRAGMYRSKPEMALAWNLSLMVLFYFVLWGISWSSLANFTLSLSPALTIVCVAISAVIVFILSRKSGSIAQQRWSSPKTFRGMKTYAAIKGFEEFLKSVEEDKLKRLQPGIFEKYLPYAMALGLESRWTKSFEGIAVKTPEWFDAAGGDFNPVGFGRALESLLACAILGAPRRRMPASMAESFARAAAIAGR